MKFTYSHLASSLCFRSWDAQKNKGPCIPTYRMAGQWSILSSNNKNPIIRAENQGTNDIWARVINFKVFQLLCSTDINVKQKRRTHEGCGKERKRGRRRRRKTRIFPLAHEFMRFDWDKYTRSNLVSILCVETVEACAQNFLLSEWPHPIYQFILTSNQSNYFPAHLLDR